MIDSASNSPLSASQEISLMTSAHKLNRLITSMGFQLPLNMIAYDCMHDLSPIGMVLLGHKVHAVNSNPTDTERLERYVHKFDTLLTYDSFPLLELGERANQSFDVALINGAVLTELRTESQLQEVCRQFVAAIKPGGLMLMSSADFDEMLRIKERVLQPRITDHNSFRHLCVVVRDWHGNGYEYTETHYLIEDGDALPTVNYQKYHRRAWRRAEITLGLMRAGIEDVQWQGNEKDPRIMIARKRSPDSSN